MKSPKLQSPRRRMMKRKNKLVNKGSRPHPATSLAKAKSFGSYLRKA